MGVPVDLSVLWMPVAASNFLRSAGRNRKPLKDKRHCDAIHFQARCDERLLSSVPPSDN